MQSVTGDSGGTAYGRFRDFNISVGGKTGSAEAANDKVHAWFVGFVIFFLFPFITSIRYSFAEVSIQQGFVGMKYLGFENYKNLFIKNPDFLPAFTDTITSVLVSLPLIIVFSLFISVVLNQKFKGRTFFRAVFFLPIIIAGGIAIDIINGNYFLGLISSGGRSVARFL